MISKHRPCQPSGAAEPGPAPLAGEPEMPERFTEAQAQVWDRYTARLRGMNLLYAADANADIVRLCREFSVTPLAGAGLRLARSVWERIVAWAWI